MKSLRMAGLAALLLASLALTGCGFEIVDNGHRGYQTRYGEVQNDVGTIKPGWAWYNPLTSDVTEVDVRTQLFSGEFETYTKDVQKSHITIKVNYHIEPDSVHVLVQSVDLDSIGERLILPAIEGDLKGVIGKFEAVELVAKRDEAALKVKEVLQRALGNRNITVESVQLSNISYSKDFEESVEKKVVAIQSAVEEQNRTVQIQEKAKQTVISAKADAESMRIRAEALAQNPKLVEFEAVKKWDGKLPQYMFGAGTTPFIDLRK